jgi:hypothetical protein
LDAANLDVCIRYRGDYLLDALPTMKNIPCSGVD